MTILTPIPALTTNYIWLIINQNNNCCAIIDPGESEPVLDYLKTEKLTPTAILITHYHNDHTAGIDAITKQFPVPIYSAHKLKGGELINLKQVDIELIIMATPGHTKDHIVYYGNDMVFTGDVLFGAGCGRVFEGTMQEMYDSLNRLRQLPDNTSIYCAHEYTLSNLKFAQTVEPKNLVIKKRIAKCQKLLQQHLPTLPSTIALEKASNPFLRCEEPNVIDAAHKHSGYQPNNPIETFSILRRWKDNWHA